MRLLAASLNPTYPRNEKKARKNWPDITLLNYVVKVFAFIILERVAPVFNTKLRTEQHDFRPKRSCVDHINSLRIIIGQSVEWRSPLYMFFIDFERAFDTIKRHAIWTALKNVGVPEKIIALIRELYQDADCSVHF